MEEADLDIVEEQGGDAGETGTEGEGVVGAEVDDRQEERELVIDILELQESES